MSNRNTSMTFNKLHDGTDCKCIEGAIVDTESLFVRKVSARSPKDRDFKSHHERKKEPELKDCESICSYRGLSVNIYKDEYIQQILEKYKISYLIAPSTGKFCLVFRFSNNAGMVESTPEKNDKSHYNFYKSDSFDCVNGILVKDVIDLR